MKINLLKYHQINPLTKNIVNNTNKPPLKKKSSKINYIRYIISDFFIKIKIFKFIHKIFYFLFKLITVCNPLLFNMHKKKYVILFIDEYL